MDGRAFFVFLEWWDRHYLGSDTRNDVKPKEGIEKREEKGRTRKNRGRTGDTHGQARSCVAGRMVLVRPV